ncbi:hypothetical protein UFOVP270_54 [uncultured Caudovirales phage]|uniref:Uncharacterized protein n=1 Tax=uncultured Caudovirales phage TaxID=2100421 RepID=A0A6J5LIK9_9CAUD|nr:hypothetical protein UFOVP101_3 [uncultured Caudovirales phage]CAB4134404.1 hypothetical protein UFOVP270_54 [uncultured Caudovirales phage]
MDLRKGSDIPAGKRRCFRCRGRKKLYKVRGAWSFDNSGGTLQNCPLCEGKGHIDPIPVTELELGCAIADIEEEKACGKKRRRKAKEAAY